MGHLIEGPENSDRHSEDESISKVLSVTIDELVQEDKLALPSYLKIDVEGGEAAVLHDGIATITKSHPTIFLATHGHSLSQECCRFLETAGYVVQPIGQKSPDGCNEYIAWYPVRNRKHCA